jgi:hypothetical protein
MVVDADEAAIGKRVQWGFVGELFFAAYASSVQFAVHDVDNGGTRAVRVARREPRISERIEAVAAAFGTGSVAGGERYGFIKEEEFGVKTWGHHGAAPAFETEEADKPAPARVGTNEFATIIMHDAAAIAQERPASGGDEDFSFRSYAVL